MSLRLCFGVVIILFVIIQIIDRYTLNKQFEQGDYENLEIRFKRMISGSHSNSTIAYAYQNLIVIYIETNRYKDAHECITKVKELGFPNSVILGINEATLLIKEGRYDEAETILNDCLKHKHISKNYNVLLLNNLIDVMINTNRMDEAKKELDSLLNEHPTNTNLLATLGDWYMAQKDFSNAKEAYIKSLQYNKMKNSSLTKHLTKQLDLINAMS